MEISRTSWHYRWLNWSVYMLVVPGSPWRSRSLCGYFWRLVGVTLVRPLLFVVYAGILAMVGILVYWLATTWAGHAATLGILTATAYILWRVSMDRRDWSIPSKPVRKPSLLTQYIKAKKARICPLIEFTE